MKHILKPAIYLLMGVIFFVLSPLSIKTEAAVDLTTTNLIDSFDLSKNYVEDGGKLTASFTFSEKEEITIKKGDFIKLELPYSKQVSLTGYRATMALKNSEGAVLGEVVVNERDVRVTFNDTAEQLENVYGFFSFEAQARNFAGDINLENLTSISTNFGTTLPSTNLEIHRGSSGEATDTFYYKTGDMLPSDTEHVRWFLSANPNQEYVKREIEIQDQIQTGHELVANSFNISIKGRVHNGSYSLKEFNDLGIGYISISGKNSFYIRIYHDYTDHAFGFFYLTKITNKEQKVFENHSQATFETTNSQAEQGRFDFSVENIRLNAGADGNNKPTTKPGEIEEKPVTPEETPEENETPPIKPEDKPTTDGGSQTDPEEENPSVGTETDEPEKKPTTDGGSQTDPEEENPSVGTETDEPEKKPTTDGGSQTDPEEENPSVGTETDESEKKPTTDGGSQTDPEEENPSVDTETDEPEKKPTTDGGSQTDPEEENPSVGTETDEPEKKPTTDGGSQTDPEEEKSSVGTETDEPEKKPTTDGGSQTDPEEEKPSVGTETDESEKKPTGDGNSQITKLNTYKKNLTDPYLHNDNEESVKKTKLHTISLTEDEDKEKIMKSSSKQSNIANPKNSDKEKISNRPIQPETNKLVTSDNRLPQTGEKSQKILLSIGALLTISASMIGIVRYRK